MFLAIQFSQIPPLTPVVVTAHVICQNLDIFGCGQVPFLQRPIAVGTSESHLIQSVQVSLYVVISGDKTPTSAKRTILGRVDGNFFCTFVC